MLCLGIETSCDDTSLALISDGTQIAHVAASQVPVHALFGGVVPELASREHSRLIAVLFDSLVADAQISPCDIDAIAVARGPGLLGSLLVGVGFAKALALGTGARLIGVNHLHAHLLACGLEQPLQLPALGLLVSGGHTHLYRVNSITDFVLLGRSLDDAAGEAFDKAGKMLGLPYPAGVFIDKLSCTGDGSAIQFPRPYLTNDSLDFSFSGLKTAMQTYLANQRSFFIDWDVQTHTLDSTVIPAELADVCAAYSQAIVDTLVEKTRRALDQHKDVRSLLLAGGVAANSLLRRAMQQLAHTNGLPLCVPSPALCTDNGAMIAYLGYQLLQAGYYHDDTFETVARGGFIPDDMKSSCADVSL